MKKENFGGRLGIIAATAGSAVGLGNLWGFPYRAGVNGGGTFVLLYILFAIALGFPVMLCEFIIGKNSNNKSVLKAFTEVKSKDNMDNSKFNISSYFAVATSFLILSFYGMIAGWSIDYLVKSINGGFGKFDVEYSSNYFEALTVSIPRSVGYHILFMVITIIVVSLGVKKGIEKISKIMMPMLIVIILILVGYGATTNGFNEAVSFLFKPSVMPSDGVQFGKVAVNAMGQAFFSLSLGSAAIMTYATYVDKKEDIVSISKQVIIADTMVALLAGLAIFPFVFSAGMKVAEGPGLIFVVLPVAFASMGYGDIIGVIFFLLVALAGFTSAISLLENISAPIVYKLNSRVKGVAIAGALVTIVGMGSQACFSFSVPFLEFIADNQLDQFDKLTAYLMPLVSFFVVIFIGYRADVDVIKSEFKNEKLAKMFLWYVRYVAPILIVTVFVSSIVGQ